MREPSLKGDETSLEIVDGRHGSLFRERHVQLRVIGVLPLVHVMAIGDTCNRGHVPIVATAVDRQTAVVGDDTALLILLCFHGDPSHHKIYFAPEPKKQCKHCIWDIFQIQKELGRDVSQGLLFTHALSGCDTTSWLFGIGKGEFLQTLCHKIEFSEVACNFLIKEQPTDEVIATGERALITMCGTQGELNLAHVRARIFATKVTNARTFVHPQHLSPTSLL